MESNESKYTKNQSYEQYVCLNEQVGERKREKQKKSKASTNRRRNFMNRVFLFFPMQFFAKKTHYIYISSIISSLREIDGVENEFFACPMATAAMGVALPFTTSV